MQPSRLPYEPTNLTPCFVLRSRREVNTVDAVNSRLINHWQSDDPQIQADKKDSTAAKFYMDMNPTSSRLYREDLRQSQPFVIPSGDSEQVKKTIVINEKINSSLSTIQGLESNGGSKSALAEQNDTYQLLLAQQRYIQTDSLSDNAYFNKYDVASDSRNIVRELRAAVSEDVVDRGVRESQKLLQRELDSRWVPQGYAKDKGIDTLSAFELMRPKFTDMGKRYH